MAERREDVAPFDPNAAFARLSAEVAAPDSAAPVQDSFDPNAAFQRLQGGTPSEAPAPTFVERMTPTRAPETRRTREPDLLRYILNSATFGAADPVLAGAATGPAYLMGKLPGGSGASLGETYRRVRDDLRAGERATEEAYGYAAPAIGIAGGMALGPGVLKMGAQGARALGRGLERVGAGAIPDAIGNVVQGGANALRASAPGRGLAHVLRGVGEGGGAGALTATLNQDFPTDRGIGAALSGIGENALTGGGIGGGIGAGIAGAYGLGRLSRGIGATAYRTPSGAALNARQLLSNSIGPEARLAQLEADLQPTATGGRPLTIFDMGAENVRSRGEAAYKQPGEGRDEVAEMLIDRAVQRPHRIAADLSASLTPNANRGAAATIDSLDAFKKAQAGPLYEKAYSFGRVASSELQPFLRRLEAAGAMSKAANMAEREGRDFSGFDRVGSGKHAIPAIDMQDVDMIQRALRHSEKSRRDQFGKATDDSRIDAALRDEFLDLVDDLNPAFKKARAAWYDSSASQDAVALGRKLLNGGEDAFENIMRDFKKIRPQDRDYFRLGLAQDVMDRMAKATPMTDAAKVFLTPRMQNRLQGAFETQADFNQFMHGMERESRMARGLTRTIGGSRTAQLGAEMGGMDAEAMAQFLPGIASAAQGHVGPLIRSVFSSAVRNWKSPTMDRKTAAELQRIMFNPSPADNQRILQEIRQIRAGQRPAAIGPTGPVPMADPVTSLSRGIGAQQQLMPPAEPETVIPVQ